MNRSEKSKVRNLNDRDERNHVVTWITDAETTSAQGSWGVAKVVRMGRKIESARSAGTQRLCSDPSDLQAVCKAVGIGSSQREESDKGEMEGKRDGNEESNRWWAKWVRESLKGHQRAIPLRSSEMCCRTIDEGGGGGDVGRNDNKTPQ
ncbi:hypothetical protein BJY52DRAFT_1223927 [Lactarius psammicola]|nr:hypothetical protein BJY52DRAFT_1223927 [Lactarius psammicola]